jgi:zinc transporter ZupT
MPGVIMMASLFVLFVIEMWLNGKMGGHSHSHGGPMGLEKPSPIMRQSPQRPPRPGALQRFDTEDMDYEKKLAMKMFEENVRTQMENPFSDDTELQPRSEMPPWFIVFYEQYVRQRMEMMNMIRSQESPAPQYEEEQSSRAVIDPNNPFADSPYIDTETGQPVDPLIYRKLSLNITLLEGGILFHSVFVGMTVSITIEGFIILLIAILFHQMFEGLGLGSRIAAVPYAKGSIRPWILVVAFGTTAPIGQAIGLMTRSTYDPNSAFGLIIVGVFNAMYVSPSYHCCSLQTLSYSSSAGLLLYAALVDLLAEDFLSEEANRVMTKKSKIVAFMFVLAGGVFHLLCPRCQYQTSNSNYTATGMSIVGAFA